MEHELVPGVYERLIDGTLRQALQAHERLESDERALLTAEAPERLAGHLADRLAGALRRRDLDGQVASTGKLLALLDLEDDQPPAGLDEPARMLTRLRPPLLPGTRDRRPVPRRGPNGSTRCGG